MHRAQLKSFSRARSNSKCEILLTLGLTPEGINVSGYKIKHQTTNLKVFILPRVAELFIHKEKQRGCPLLGANRYTHIYITAIYVYIYIIYLFETIVSKAWPPSSVFL